MRREVSARAAWRLFWATALVAAGAACVMVWVAQTHGLPQGIARRVLAAIAGPQRAVEAGRVRLRGLQSVQVEGLKVYARGVVGPAGFECDRAEVRGRLVRALRGRGFVDELHVNHAILRPAFLRPRGDSPAAPGAGRVAEVGTYRLSAAHFECAGVHLRDLSCEVEPGADRVHARNIACRAGGEGEGDGENCTGDLLIDAAARTVSGRFKTAFDPAVAIPILRHYGLTFVCDLIGRFAFDAVAPRSEFTFVKPMDVRGDLHVDARLWMETFRYRGVDVVKGDATVIIDHAVGHTQVSLSPLLVSRPEGTARVDLTVDTAEGLVRFNGTSSLQPHALTRLIGIFTNAWADAVIADGACRIESTGVADLRGDSRQFIRTSARGERLGVGRVVADDVSFIVLTEGATSRVENATGRLFDGTVQGGGMVVAPRHAADDALRYRVAGSFTDGDFLKVVSAFTPEAKVRDLNGRMFLNLDIEGPLGSNWWHDVRGFGVVKVRDGRVFMLPVFGGLSGYLARIVPGVDFMLRQGDFTSEFTLGQQEARSERVSVEGDVFSLQGRGTYGFDRRLDMSVQVKLLKDDPLLAKVVRLITWPLSKLFEFRLTGTLDDPRWYPVNFSHELLENLGLKEGNDDRGAADNTP